MRLNHDCIRELMLYIEDNIKYSSDTIAFTPMCNNFSNYTENELVYHINMLYQAGFIQKPTSAGRTIALVPSLTWTGHEYLDNIRDKTAWQMVKDGAFDLSSMSLSLVGQLSKELLFSYAKKKCGLD